jgi:hypothetical protein
VRRVQNSCGRREANENEPMRMSQRGECCVLAAANRIRREGLKVRCMTLLEFDRAVRDRWSTGSLRGRDRWSTGSLRGRILIRLQGLLVGYVLAVGGSNSCEQFEVEMAILNEVLMENLVDDADKDLSIAKAVYSFARQTC